LTEAAGMPFGQHALPMDKVGYRETST
jgi:hypothetical protein